MINFIPPEPGRPYAVFAAEAGERPTQIPGAEFIAAYKAYGAILLRGFTVTMEGFRDLTSAYCSSSVFNESPDRMLLDEERNIQTVNFGVDAFPLHPEMSREPWKPDVCFFWCMNPPSAGGETTICDGVEIVKQMPPEVFDAFKSRRLVYTQRMAPHVCAYWLGSADPDDEAIAHPLHDAPYRFFRVPGGVARQFSRPALHKPMFTDDLAFGNFILFARYYLNVPNFPAFDGGERIPDDIVREVKAISDAITTPVPWRRGDITILDNTRFMHGRNPIIDGEERRIATFFGYLNFAAPLEEEPANAPWRKGFYRPPMAMRPQADGGA